MLQPQIGPIAQRRTNAPTNRITARRLAVTDFAALLRESLMARLQSDRAAKDSR
jgi:hypothetical protein